jgi:CelD/BcsL family acetyltransferase involved in cellulose biosynthesis
MQLQHEADFDFGSPEYRAFFARAGLTPFQHPDWLVPFYRRLPGPDGSEPLVLVGRAPGSRELTCVIPLLRQRRPSGPHVTFAFLGVTDYACPVIDPGPLVDVSLANDLERLVGAHTLDIRPIHHAHAALWSRLLGRDPELMDYGSHAVGLAGPMPDWRRGHYGPNQLHGLPRKARRLAELGDVRLDLVSGGKARDCMALARSFRAGRFPGDPLQVDASATFYADVAATGGDLARTFRLSCGDEVVAVMFGLVHGRRFHYVVLACDYANFARFSPGLLIMDLAIEAWAASGGEIFDFTIGDEPFKANFGCQRTPMYLIGDP